MFLMGTLNRTWKKYLNPNLIDPLATKIYIKHN